MISDIPTVLIAEDDPDDRVLFREIFGRLEYSCEIQFVENGEELMDYLLRLNRYSDPSPPMPALILLDLHMPKKSGREAILEIQKRTELEKIPLVVWTTSSNEEDRRFCMEAGASDYVTKPVNFIEMDTAVRGIVRAWLPGCSPRE